MTTRTTTTTVTFKSPFTLPGWDDQWPAGDYQVATDEELLDTSFPAWRRIATTIELPRGAVTKYVDVDPTELARAIEQDQRAKPLR